MIKRKPVFLFQIDLVRVCSIVGIIAMIVLVIYALTHQAYNEPETNPTIHERHVASITNDTRLFSILYQSKENAGYTWKVRFNLQYTDGHTNGWVNITLIQRQREGSDVWWQVFNENDPIGRSVIAYQGGLSENTVTLKDTFFRGAYRTAEAIISAYFSDPCQEWPTYAEGLFIYPHVVSKAAGRMIGRLNGVPR